MKFLIDMNLSPSWRTVLESAGFEATHWSAVGRFDAPDSELFDWAAAYDSVLFTNDLDFGSLLAVKSTSKPSVFQLRGQELAPERVGAQVASVLRAVENDLAAGALVTWDLRGARVRILPLK